MRKNGSNCHKQAEVIRSALYIHEQAKEQNDPIRRRKRVGNWYGDGDGRDLEQQAFYYLIDGRFTINCLLLKGRIPSANQWFYVTQNRVVGFKMSSTVDNKLMRILAVKNYRGRSCFYRSAALVWKSWRWRSRALLAPVQASKMHF